MFNRLIALLTTVLAVAAMPAAGATVSYTFSVNTSSQLGNNGYIDIQLNPGLLVSPAVSAGITSFTGAALNASDPSNASTGAVTGALPGPLTIENTGTTNDYFEALTFGNALSFDLTLSGPGVDPTGSAGGSSGTTFLLDFLDSTQSSYLFSNDPSGSTTSDWAVGLISFDPTGIETVTLNPGPGGGAPDGTLTPAGAAPEPAAWVLMASGLAALAYSRQRRR